ncbi:Hypothetical predicted protein [Podarcis lilfordi]|uniref:Uncharacterized protein n=1 Tax=Podarcis lilfordi TaxID=74358 RepID=A0AA35JWT2_9SAUR|nr:Hypothetical predicted protein [Podarcis lilfordi]
MYCDASRAHQRMEPAPLHACVLLLCQSHLSYSKFCAAARGDHTKERRRAGDRDCLPRKISRMVIRRDGINNTPVLTRKIKMNATKPETSHPHKTKKALR